MRARDFLTREERKSVEDCIGQAELTTSGEIRIHIETKCKVDPRERALRTFSILGMDRTVLRNAVLIYIATEPRKFVVLGDKGINAVVPEGFWDDVCRLLRSKLSSDQRAEALTLAVRKIGEKLSEFFPYSPGDINELPDEISYGEDDADDSKPDGNAAPASPKESKTDSDSKADQADDSKDKSSKKVDSRK